MRTTAVASVFSLPYAVWDTTILSFSPYDRVDEAAGTCNVARAREAAAGKITRIFFKYEHVIVKGNRIKRSCRIYL